MHCQISLHQSVLFTTVTSIINLTLFYCPSETLNVNGEEAEEYEELEKRQRILLVRLGFKGFNKNKVYEKNKLYKCFHGVFC